MEINWSLISTIVSAVTAIIAIVAPVITSIQATKSQERMKKMELFSPRVYDALAEMVKAYAELNHFDLPADGFDTQMILTKEASERCQIFSAASLKVMSLVPSAQVQKHISGLLADIGNTTYSPSPEHDKIFFQLIADVNAYLLAPKSRKIKNKKHSAQD